MRAVNKPVILVQVRELVDFVWRRGDLGGERDFVGRQRALAGIRGQQHLQRSRPAGYEPEVRVAHEIDAGEFTLRVQGRIDGLLAEARPVLLEEIKTVQGGWDGQADPLHWAQAKCYAFIYGQQHGLEQLALQLSYLDLDSGKATELRQEFPQLELAAFFHETTAIYIDWLRERLDWRRQRDHSIHKLAFAFPRYRPGQRELAVATYRALRAGGRLFLEAPTGIGKSVSVLFPAIKALGEGRFERLFYLTARTLGRTAAQKALQDLRAAGLRLCGLSLTAREKLCLQEGQPCDPAVCPLARGYYDRRRPAMREALQTEELTRPTLEALSRTHQVCPFELSLDLSSWVDAVICDYNYVFDPQVYLRRHFAEEGGRYAFLVDEAHNLVDRAREMFSAELDTGAIQAVRRELQGKLPRCARALSRLATAMRHLAGAPASVSVAQVSKPAVSPTSKSAAPAQGLHAGKPAIQQVWKPALQAGGGSALSQPEGPELELGLFPSGSAEPGSGNARRDFPAELTALLERALKEAEAWLSQNQPAEFRPALLELYFGLLTFARTAELYDERYVTLVQPGAGVQVRLFCLDPSHLLRQALARGTAAVFFSATLTPLEYYRELLGGNSEDRTLRLASPFPPEHLALLVQDRLRTDFKSRAATSPEVVQAIAAVLEARSGNYLVYFPSYQYLQAVREQFQELYPETRLLIQQPGMSETEREEFLAAFSAEHRETLLGFAVLGGIFGEGIDLVGERLIGAIIVGVGLPQLCLERDLIRDYFQARNGAGFDYAYTFPGMNRVLQATGRVIRSETDRGAVLLIDARFGQGRYRRLFPPWWQPVPARSPEQIRVDLGRFWSAV